MQLKRTEESRTVLPTNYFRPDPTKNVNCSSSSLYLLIHQISGIYKVDLPSAAANIFCGFSFLDKNTPASIMLKASTRWLAIRGDIISIFLLTSVSAGALFATQSPGSQHFAAFSFTFAPV